MRKFIIYSSLYTVEEFLQTIEWKWRRLLSSVYTPLVLQQIVIGQPTEFLFIVMQIPVCFCPGVSQVANRRSLFVGSQENCLAQVAELDKSVMIGIQRSPALGSSLLQVDESKFDHEELLGSVSITQLPHGPKILSF